MYQSTNTSHIHTKISVMHDAHDGTGPRWRELRQFEVDGEQVVGVEEGEAFKVHVTPRIPGSSVRELVELRVSIDGTDVLTGERAGVGVEGKRWAARGEGISLEAWPQSEQGGARFVFTYPNGSVAAHTHGDTSHVGIIGVAMFVESQRQSQSMSVLRGATRSGGFENFGANIDRSATASFGDARFDSAPQKSGPASVGAGEFAEQRLTTVTGLSRPCLHAVSHVRYMWWEDLQRLLRRERHTPQLPGFPARAPAFTGINLGSTPQTASTAANVSTRFVM